MIAVTVDEIATVLGAQLSGPGDTTAVVTCPDSRLPGGRGWCLVRRAAWRACRWS